MKNLKKVLALVMACAMLFTMSSFAFTDVAEDASYLEAVTLLSKLGIINGYEDGTFLPDNTITRAEVAKVLVCALNAADQAEGMKADNIFTDVPADHWAAGYINYAANMGIISGRGNGIYDPEAPVTYEEVVKLIVAMLGYTPVANVKGGYPTGYLYVANQMIKISKGATGVTGDAAKRWVVARLIYNSLEVKMMEQETWSAADPEFVKGEDTLLDDYLEITKLEGVITETFYQTFTDKEDQDITFDITTIDGSKVMVWDEEEEVRVAGSVEKVYEANGTGAEEYLGYTVVAYVKNYDEGDEELVAVSPKAGKNATLEIALGDFGAEDDMDPLASKNYFTFEYFVEDDTKTVKALDAALFYENGVENVTEDALWDTIAGAGEGYEGADGVVTFLDNDGNGVYDYAFLEEISNEIVVDEITKRTYKVSGKNGGSVKLDAEDEATYVTFYKDGQAASFDDIAEGDVLSIVVGGNGDKVKKVYISSEKVEGYVSSTSAAGYKIEGTIYKKSSFFGDEIARRDSGIFYINYNGRIAYTETEAEVGGNYAFLLGVNTNESFSSGVDYTLRFMNTKGEWIDANLAETVTYTVWSEEEGKMVSDKISDFEDMDKIADLTGGWLDAVADEDMEALKLEMDGALVNRIFQYTLNSNGEITKIVVAKTGAALDEDNFSYVALADEYDALGNRFKNTSLKGGVSEDTVVFVVDLKEDDEETLEDETQEIYDSLKKSQISIADYTMFEDEETYEGYVYDYANDAYKCMVITNAETSIDKEAKLLVVDTVEITSNDDEEEYIIIEGYMDGEEVTLETVADENLAGAIDIALLDGTGVNYEALEDYTDGAVFEVALDAAGDITDIKIVFAGKAAFEDALIYGELSGNENDEEPYYYFGAIATEKIKTSSSAKFIQLMDLDNEEFVVDGEDETIDFATAGSSMKGNIYNVDLTTRNAKYDVADSIADYVGSVIFDEYEAVDFAEMNGEDVYYALVKVLEDDTMDIVVYTAEYAVEEEVEE